MTKEEIKMALKERGWSYQMLAEKLRVSEGAIKNALSSNGKLTDQLSAHIELLLNSTQEQIMLFKVTYPEVLCRAWLPGWDELTPEQRQDGLQAVMLEAAKLAAADGEKELSPEQWAELRAFCSTLRGPSRVFEYKAEMNPFA